jgi:general secretion pathway protein E
MVGEIRDKETAEIAMKSSLTGHLVLSTLHTNDALSTLFRLKDMGIEPYLISSTVIGILAQRLVRILCEDCKEPYRPPARALKLLFQKTSAVSVSPDMVLYRVKGCQKCQFSGYHGRKGIFELLVMNDELKQIIQSGSNEAIKGSWVPKTLRDSGLELVKEGLTTVEEVYRTTVE